MLLYVNHNAVTTMIAPPTSPEMTCQSAAEFGRLVSKGRSRAKAMSIKRKKCKHDFCIHLQCEITTNSVADFLADQQISRDRIHVPPKTNVRNIKQ